MPKGIPKIKTQETGTVNPFEIKDDLLHSGNLSNQNYVPAILEQVLKLDSANRMQSVNIPLSICPDRATAANMFLSLRRYMDAKGQYGHIVLASRGIKDEKGNYSGSRIWRLK